MRNCAIKAVATIPPLRGIKIRGSTTADREETREDAQPALLQEVVPKCVVILSKQKANDEESHCCAANSCNPDVTVCNDVGASVPAKLSANGTYVSVPKH